MYKYVRLSINTKVTAMVCIDNSIHYIEIAASLNLLFYVLYFIRNQFSFIQPLYAINLGLVLYGILVYYFSTLVPSNPVAILGIQIAFALLIVSILKAIQDVTSGLVALMLLGPIWIAGREYLLSSLQRYVGISVSELCVAIISLIIVLFVALLYMQVQQIRFFRHVYLCVASSILATWSIHYFIIAIASAFTVNQLCCSMDNNDDTCVIGLTIGYILVFVLLFLLRMLAMRISDRLRKADLIEKEIQKQKKEEEKKRRQEQVKAKRFGTKSEKQRLLTIKTQHVHIPIRDEV